MSVGQRLTSHQFTIAKILDNEATFLCKCSPSRDTAKPPSGSKSGLTQLSKQGEGDAHCAVKKWPQGKTPAEWGRKNRALLLEEAINPEIFNTLTNLHSDYDHIRGYIEYTRLPILRGRDNGNEEAFRDILPELISRATACAYLFFYSQWLKPKNSSHDDYLNAMQTLQTFLVKTETTSPDSHKVIGCRTFYPPKSTTPNTKGSAQ